MARKSRKTPIEAIVSPPEKIFYNAAAYVRLSSDTKIKPSESLEIQKDIIERFVASSPDIRISEIYSDNNMTGTNFDRPSFMRMLSDIECGRINCIVVKDLSRFGRNAIDVGYYLEKYLPSRGVRFISVTDEYDSLDGDGGIILPLKNIIAESYALDISRKCRSTQRQNMLEGRFIGRMATYGFSKSPEDCHKLIVDWEAADVVRRIFRLASCGINRGEIVRMLNEEEILPPSHYKREKGLITNEKLVGKPYWHKRTITDILSDRVYVGDMVQGKTRTINHKEIPVNPDEWICVKNTHEAIVSHELYDRVQEVLEKSSREDEAARSPITPYTPNLFKGKVLCAHCGHSMHRHRQNKDGIYWYRCESQWKYHKDACYQVSVKESDLKAGIISLLNKHAETIMGSYIHIERTLPDEQDSLNAELSAINIQLNNSGNFLKKLYETKVEGLITTQEFISMKANYEQKIDTLSRKADELRSKQMEKRSGFDGYRNFSDAVSQTLCNDELTAEIADALVEKILIRRDKSFEIILRFKDEFQEVRSVG